MKHFDSPVTHVIIDEFFDEQDKAIDECHGFQKDYSVGLYMNGRGQQLVDPIKSNVAVNLDQMYVDRHESYILSAIPQKLWSKDAKIELENFGPMYKMWAKTIRDRTQLSVYGNGDHYGYHVDKVNNSPLSLIVFLFKEPKMFEGGDIMLKGDDGVIKTIHIKSNMGLIFPSLTQHCVTEIKTNSDKFEDKRISVQYWAGY